MNISSTSASEINSHRPPLAFVDNDLLDEKTNKYIPLLIRAIMANFEVRRILVNQWRSANIMFLDLLTRLWISEEDLTPYRGTDLSGYNGSKAKPLELSVTYGEEPLTWTVKTPFLVFPWNVKLVQKVLVGRIIVIRVCIWGLR